MKQAPKAKVTKVKSLLKKAGLYDLLSEDDQNLIEMQMGSDTADDFVRNFVDPNIDQKNRKALSIKLFRSLRRKNK